MRNKIASDSGRAGRGGNDEDSGKLDNTHFQSVPQPTCRQCCFYREITLASGGVRLLCSLTGAKRPGADGCCFMSGEWEALNRILRLRKARAGANLDFPNIVRRGKCLASIPNTGTKIANNNISALNLPAGIIGGKVGHMSGRLTSGSPRGPSSFTIARERQTSAFLCLNPEYREAPYV